MYSPDLKEALKWRNRDKNQIKVFFTSIQKVYVNCTSTIQDSVISPNYIQDHMFSSTEALSISEIRNYYFIGYFQALQKVKNLHAGRVYGANRKIRKLRFFIFKGGFKVPELAKISIRLTWEPNINVHLKASICSRKLRFGYKVGEWSECNW